MDFPSVLIASLPKQSGAQSGKRQFGFQFHQTQTFPVVTLSIKTFLLKRNKRAGDCSKKYD